ncbi:MAG TPA: DUF721 domain-containing protein [Saprospiraceae bacterium]|nr:DUF721 domain-containing protein [Saprospiraceae bacterium]HRO08149.1 DUF721 domain-containing protein [Saprospiraceae bacterium]HRP41542.1 DUF721 domain-containing protein [Saprospiraceae bacterium]
MGRHNDKNIKEVLGEYLSTNKRISKGYYTSHIDEVWRQMMGPTISDYTTKLNFKDGLLRIYLNSSTLKKELSMSKDKIIRMLNEALGHEVVQEVELY